MARFSFKSWSAIGYLQFFLILYGIKTLNLKLSNQNKLLAILIISNLVLFFYIPAELSYLQPAIIFLYLIIVKEFKKKVILFLITLNFINWGINFQLLKIIHKDNSLCGPKQAVSASIDLGFKHGAIYDFYESRKMIKCWINGETERGKRILEGKSLRVKK